MAVSSVSATENEIENTMFRSDQLNYIEEILSVRRQQSFGPVTARAERSSDGRFSAG
jgi:hypothetical protein